MKTLLSYLLFAFMVAALLWAITVIANEIKDKAQEDREQTKGYKTIEVRDTGTEWQIIFKDGTTLGFPQDEYKWSMERR
jgi:hypothetical protein